MRRLCLLPLLFAALFALPAEAAPRAANVSPDPVHVTEEAPNVAKVQQGPVRIVIEQIGMDQEILSVGLDDQKVPIVPDHNVGWYNLSAKPGAGENIVLWGHVLRFRETPKLAAPFGRVKELKKGAVIVLYTADGKEHRYVVIKQLKVKPNEVKYILPVGKERLTLVSCSGNKVIVDGDVRDMTHRLITIAEPES